MSIQDIAPDWLTFHRASEVPITWKRPPVYEKLSDPETYIHHGAGGRFGNDSLEAVRRLQNWYHNSLNYSTIAYDIMVHRNVAANTVAIIGAREAWQSAATRERNEEGEAICLMGYFHPGHQLSEQPTEREIEALAFAVAWSIENGWSAPNTKIMGHRQNPAHPNQTSCPGDFLFPHVPAIGQRAFELLELSKQTTPPPPPIPQKDEDMELFLKTGTVRKHEKSKTLWLTAGTTVVPIDQGQLDHYRIPENFGGRPIPVVPCPDDLHRRYSGLYPITG